MMKDVEEKTCKFNDIVVRVAVDYSGKYDISQSCYKIMKSGINVDNPEDLIPIIEKNLYTEDDPPVDLLIRTAGDHRISNYLLWQIAYSEILVTKEYWPEMNKKLFFYYLNQYKAKERRFGN